MENLVTIAVIGAGPLGLRLAHLCAKGGFHTILEDVLPSNLRRAEAHLSQRETATPAFPIEYASSIEDAVRGADLIIDCLPDELESKLEIFSLLDRMAPPRAILGTPTRRLSIADLASCTYRPDRCIAFELPEAWLETGPVSEARPVVVVRTRETLPEVVTATAGFWQRLGMAVTMREDPGTAPEN